MSTKITKISSTSEKISGCGWLSLFMRYLKNIGLYELFSKTVNALRANARLIEPGEVTIDFIMDERSRELFWEEL